MLVKTFNMDGTPQRVEVQTNTSTLLIRIVLAYPKAAFDTAIAATPANTVADALLPVLRSMTLGNVTISKYNNSGTDTLYNNLPLCDLMEICAFGRGMVRHTNISTAADITATRYVYATEFAIPLSNLGSIRADKSTFVVFEYTNPAATVPSVSTITVNAVASYQASSGFIKLDNLTAQDNQITNFDCVNNYAVIVPSTVTKVSLDAATGERLEIVDKELPILQLATSDIIHQINGAMYSSRYWFGIDITSAYRGQLLNVSKTPFYLLSNAG